LVTIALHKPQIPPNTGNVSRLCVGLQAPLYIIGKPAFDIDSKAVKRAGLDHWDELDLSEYRGFKDFSLDNMGMRKIAVTKEGKDLVWDFKFKLNDVIIFGNETHGLPPSFINNCEESVRIPMYGNIRSLNLSNSVAVVVYEAFRQLTQNKEVNEKRVSRKYYRK